MATTYDEEVLKRSEKMAQARKAAPVQTAAAPQTNRFLKPAYPVAAGGLAALSQAVSEKESLDRVSNDPNATALDKGAAFGGATARTMGAGAGAIYGGAKGAALGSMAGPIGTAVGGVVGAGLGGYLGSKSADMAIEGGKDAVATQIGIPRNKPADPAQAEQAQQAAPYRNESLTATSARNIPAPQQQPVGQQSMQPTAPQQAATQSDIQTGKPETTAMQQPLGKDIGFGIRKLEMPGETPVYMGEGPNPSFAPAVGGAYAPANRQINMPVLNRGMGVFSSMADFVNQAGKAYGAIAQNKSDNKSARIGMDVVKMNSDISQNALKLGMDQQRADSDMGLNAIKQAQLNLQNNSMSALDAARQEYLAAGDDPAKQRAAAKKLAVLSGKDNQKDGGTWDSIVVGGGVDELGRKVGGTAMLYNKSTGEVRPIGEQQAQAKTAATGQKYTVGQTVVKPDGSRGRVVAIDANGMATEIQPL